MRTLRAQLPLYLFIFLTSIAAPVQGQKHTSRASARLIVVADLSRVDLDRTALELVRDRMPVTVAFGRFVTSDGVLATLCVYARRSAARAQPASPGIQNCPSIGVMVDGVSISDAGGYLETTRVSNLQSMELISASETKLFFGMAGGADEVLVIWTPGRGPHARR